MKNFISASTSTHKLINLSTKWLKGLRLKRMARSLEGWKFRPAVKPVSYIGRKAYGLEKQTRRLSWDFISPDFITPFNFLTIKPFNPNALAFTMAEILISLTIIGVIAAITLPSLRANINESAWATQRKALYSRLSQAIALMPSLNGYGVVMNTDGTINASATKTNAAQAFITDGLAKVLKINNICDSTNLKKCGLPQKIKKVGTHTKINTPTMLMSTGTVYGIVINTDAAAFETSNGESVVAFYNPFCQSGLAPEKYFGQLMCVNFIYDLNGLKGPNAYGKDIGFITVLYPTDSSVVMPVIDINSSYRSKQNYQLLNWRNALKFCRSYEQKLPNIEELVSLMLNCNFTINCSGAYWSSTPISPNYNYGYGCLNGHLEKYTIQTATNVQCIKR